jgi:type I restriction enzyme R subunit
MSTPGHCEAAFESVIEAQLFTNGYVKVARERAILSELVLAAILQTTSGESRLRKLEALHGDKTGEQVLGDPFKWMDQNGSLATLRHGFKCYARTLHAAFVGTYANSSDARGNLHPRPGGQL